MSGVNGTNNFASEKNFDYDSSWSGLKRTLVSGATIESDGSLTTQNINITGKYYNLTISQSSLEGKAFTGKIYVTNHKCETRENIEYGYMTILNANGGKDSIIELPDSAFANASTASDKGMYKKADDLGTSYYFRGAVNNNWVQFGKEQSVICTYNDEQVSVGIYDDDAKEIVDAYKINTQSECTGSGICLSSYFGPVIGVSQSNCSADGDTWVNSSPIYGGLKEEPIFWRIIRINGDGSIRMIYSGTTDPKNESSVTGSNGVYMTGTGTQTQITVDNTDIFKFNGSQNKAEYVGYQYIEGQQHGYGECNGTNASCIVNGNTVYNSTIKQAIDKWYAGTTLEKDASTKVLVSQDQIFCNDRSASSTQTAAWASTGADYYYGAYGRLISKKEPQLICPIASDKFTVNTSNGNGALTYPVGLITTDEVAMAGGVVGSRNRSYYLYINNSYWTGSPGFFDGSSAYEHQVSVDGTLGSIYMNYLLGVRPVISLSPKAKLSGSGTYNDVYTVS